MRVGPRLCGLHASWDRILDDPSRDERARRRDASDALRLARSCPDCAPAAPSVAALCRSLGACPACGDPLEEAGTRDGRRSWDLAGHCRRKGEEHRDLMTVLEVMES